MAEDRALAPLIRDTSPSDTAEAADDLVDMPPLRSGLSGPAKAAVIVRFLLNEGADLALETLPEDLQARLAKQMADMGLVTRDTLTSVAQEFAEALDGVGLTFPNDLSGALTALEGRISPQTARRMRQQAGVRLYGDPWARLRAVDVADLVPLVTSESTEVSAVLLSKLDVEKAAALLSELPGPVARRITYAVSRTANVSPDAVDRIGLSLASQLDMKPPAAFDDSPESRVGAILNQSSLDTRDQMLTALDETDGVFATAVRRKIFTFADIPARLAPRDVPRLTMEVEPDTLVTALAAATEPDMAAVAEFLLGNMSTRMADNLRDEVTDRGEVNGPDSDAAMTTITAAIQRLELAGEINLIVPEQEEPT